MLQLRLLGPPEINLAGAAVTEALSNKAQAILYYLAVTGQPQFRAALATLLWGDTPDDAARANLRKALANLRQVLADYLEIDRQTVAFQANRAIWVDVVEFKANANSSTDIRQLSAAVELYRGDFLAGFYVLHAADFEAWMLAEQARLREVIVQALHTLAGYHGQQGELVESIAYTRQLLNLEPWREEAYRQLMLLLARAGQRSAALAQFEICRHMLAEELGVEPGRETIALYERIRDGELGRAAAPTADSAEAKPPYKEEQEGREDVFTAVPLLPRPLTRPSTQPAHNLPSQPTSFVGREKELAEIHRLLLEEPACRLLTLVGPGGIGKTRLALAAAAGVADAFPLGVCFVALASVTGAEFLASAVAEAIGLNLSGQTEPETQLLNYLRGKKLLLVLDNFEQLIAPPPSPPEGGMKGGATPEGGMTGGATPQGGMTGGASPEEKVKDGTELLSEILAFAPEVMLLVTSRERLNLQEEWSYEVQGMEVPTLEDWEDGRPVLSEAEGAEGWPSEYSRFHGQSLQGITSLISYLEKYNAVQLFLQRARRAQANFNLSAEDVPHVVRICQLVEGMPLGLELAAPWVRVMTYQEIVQEIERNLDFLTSPMRNVPERHRSLRVVFEQTWQRLPAAEQLVLRTRFKSYVK